MHLTVRKILKNQVAHQTGDTFVKFWKEKYSKIELRNAHHQG